MATISETLLLNDRFTAAFTNYIKLSEKANVSSKELSAATKALRNESAALKAAYQVEAAAASAKTAQIRQTAAAEKYAAQQAEAAQRATDQLTKSQNKAASSSENLTSMLKRLGVVAGTMKIGQWLVSASDTIANTTARLNMMNDGAQKTEELMQMVYQAAQNSRGAFASTADMVGKLGTLAGDAFNSSAEIVDFAEQLNKQIVLSGASTQAADAAMLQLTQAMSSGVLRGEELNSILEQTPMIAQTIAGYMGVSTGEMRELASEGQVTAEVVKNAILGAAEETNKAFEDMPMTWSQVWTQMQNFALMALQPVLNGINALANNIEIIGPIVIGVGAAFAIFQIAANWTKIASVATTVYTAVVNLLSIGFGVLTGNTAAASAAVFTFNSALLASPVTWVVMGIMLLVAALYAGVAAFNKLTDSSVSATGIIVGVVAVAGAAIYNTIIGVLNAIIQLTWTIFVEPFIGIVEFVLNAANGGFNSFGDAVANLIGNIISWFLSLGKVVTTIIDAIFGTNWTAGLSSLQDSVLSWGKNENSITMDRNAPLYDRIAYSDAWNAGYGWGSNFNPLGNLFSFGGESSGYSSTAYDELAGDVSSIADDASSISKSVNMADEDLQNLVDMAEREYVNNVNLTAQTPVITINGANTGNTQADRQNLANTIRDILIEQVAAGSTKSTARQYSGG